MINELARDFSDALATMPRGHPKRQFVSTLRDTLRLSSHVLTRDPLQLPGQFWGRLSSGDSDDVASLLAEARRRTMHPWLHPLKPSLTGARWPSDSDAGGAHKGRGGRFVDTGRPLGRLGVSRQDAEVLEPGN